MELISNILITLWSVTLIAAVIGFIANGINSTSKPEDTFCPVCGYYCLGKGGYFCIDKPTLVTKIKK